MNFQEIAQEVKSLAPLTKKDLCQIYELKKLDTVTSTLAACGLPTRKREYDADEILTRFHVAREGIEKGWEYEDVRAFFKVGVKDAEASPEEQSSATGYGNHQGQESASTSDLATLSLMNKLAKGSAKKGVKVFLPLLQMHLATEFNSPEFQADFEQMTAKLDPQGENVDDFLFKGLEHLGLLPQSMQQPQASLPQSDDY